MSSSLGKRSFPKRATVWVGLAFGAGCLVAFTWNARWDEIGQVLAAANVPLIVAASACLLTTSVARAWRWYYLLREAPVAFRHRLTSTLIGFAGNNVLPGRLGEPLRCWALSRLDGRIGFWQVAGSVVVERVFDLAAAVVLLVAFVWLAPIRADVPAGDAAFVGRLEEHAAVAAVVVIAVGLVLGVVAHRRLQAGQARGSLMSSLAALQDGVAGLRSVRAVALAAVFTVILWVAMLAFELLMLWAFGFHELGAVHALGLLVVLSFAIALPQAPAGVGVVQLASETTLTALYGMPVGRAKAFAIGLWACQVSVVVGAGAVALWLEGLSLADIRSAQSAIEELPAPASPE